MFITIPGVRYNEFQERINWGLAFGRGGISNRSSTCETNGLVGSTHRERPPFLPMNETGPNVDSAFCQLATSAANAATSSG